MEVDNIEVNAKNIEPDDIGANCSNISGYCLKIGPVCFNDLSFESHAAMIEKLQSELDKRQMYRDNRLQRTGS